MTQRLMFNAHIINGKIPFVTQDSGWVVSADGRCWTTWHRTVKLEDKYSVDDLIEYLSKTQDYPGMWLEYSKGLSKGGNTVLVSTYDSSD
jgi:hypothetical protein